MRAQLKRTATCVQFEGICWAIGFRAFSNKIKGVLHFFVQFINYGNAVRVVVLFNLSQLPRDLRVGCIATLPRSELTEICQVQLPSSQCVVISLFYLGRADWKWVGPFKHGLSPLKDVGVVAWG